MSSVFTDRPAILSTQAAELVINWWPGRGPRTSTRTRLSSAGSTMSKALRRLLEEHG
ncbi:MAG: hypothetical protein ABWY12_10080 [Burkholderiales bacterium]|jgi:hypothetical protein